MTSDPTIDYSLFGGAESLPPSKSLNVESPSSGSRPLRTVVTAPGVPHPAGTTAKDIDPNDFLWLMTEEPHRSRRKAILKAHPEVTKLMGHEPLTKFVVTFVVGLQIATAFYLRKSNPLSPTFLLAAYAIGGTANHNLFLAVHEITHNLAFRGIRANKWFAMFANLPIGIPYAMTFKRYHIEHHKQMGEDGVDTDLPTKLELLCLQNVAGKAFFCTFQILFYALRPGFVRTQRPTLWHAANIVIQLAFDYLLYITLGPRALLYFVFSSFFAGSLHPCAGHFIAEHYLWDGLEQETYSYYGPLNILAYNVGYHNEHHDFPSIPWTRLPALRALAPEFYDTIPSHPSWPMIIYNFIFDDNVGMFARAKRLPKDQRVEQSVVTASAEDVDSLSVSGSDTLTAVDPDDPLEPSPGDSFILQKGNVLFVSEETLCANLLKKRELERGYASEEEDDQDVLSGLKQE